MKATDVVHAYSSRGYATNLNFQLVPLGTSCRLYSFQIYQNPDPSAAGYPLIGLYDGGDGGTLKFKFGYYVHASTSNSQFLIAPANLPSRGIRFEDGIYVELYNPGSGAFVGGVKEATATVQGVTGHIDLP